MQDIQIVALVGAIGSIMGGMWFMFRSLQNNFLSHLEKSDGRYLDLLTTKNGHLERIAREFNQTVKEFQAVLSTHSEQLNNLDVKCKHDK